MEMPQTVGLSYKYAKIQYYYTLYIALSPGRPTEKLGVGCLGMRLHVHAFYNDE
jgi:hypothetical protein